MTKIHDNWNDIVDLNNAIAFVEQASANPFFKATDWQEVIDNLLVYAKCYDYITCIRRLEKLQKSSAYKKANPNAKPFFTLTQFL